MLIDWFTVIAQIVNFLILAWLLKRFLYQPILSAIDAREKRIATQLADAKIMEADAQKERDEFKRKNEEFTQQRAALMTLAVDDAARERQRLIDDARVAADALSATRLEALKIEIHQFRDAIIRRTRDEVFSISRKALTDLASTTLEERLVEVFLRRLQGLDDMTRNALSQTFNSTSAPALVRSAFDLSGEQRTAIQNAINENLQTRIDARFETAPNLISGIELNANGHTVAWNISEYLASLEKEMDQLLKVQGSPATTETRLNQGAP
jgi:F-type H+-transporting ATPase subunit b